MRLRVLFILFAMLFSLGTSQVVAQTNAYDLQFVIVKNDMVAAGEYDVKIQIKSSGSQQFAMGTGGLAFTYNTTGLNAPTNIAPANFSGGNYSTLALSEPVTGRVVINIVLNSTNNGTTISTDWMDVATIDFTIAQPQLTANLAWRTASPNQTGIFVDDEITVASIGTLNDSDGLLPVELSSFTHNVFQNKVSLNWATQTETDNLGFEIERSVAGADFEKVGFVEGSGTTVVAQSYSFEDNSLQPGAYSYRLKQVDLDGAFDYSESIQIEITAPKNFTIAQNYPNPFNPETKIDYTLPENANVSIAIYNLKGQFISQLVNGEQAPGFHSVNWNGRNDSGLEVASGVYIYSISANKFRESRKLTFIR